MRVITFSRFFPVSHPRKGEPTLFVEKIMRGLHLWTPEAKAISDMAEWAKGLEKHHTIRAGDRWKVGDFFSPRVWSDRPYASKQIKIAPPIEIKKIWGFEHEIDKDYHCILIDNKPFFEWNSKLVTNIDGMETLAKNDGLEVKDLINWFNKAFVGQIICWNENIEY